MKVKVKELTKGACSAGIEWLKLNNYKEDDTIDTDFIFFSDISQDWKNYTIKRIMEIKKEEKKHKEVFELFKETVLNIHDTIYVYLIDTQPDYYMRGKIKEINAYHNSSGQPALQIMLENGRYFYQWDTNNKIFFKSAKSLKKYWLNRIKNLKSWSTQGQS